MRTRQFSVLLAVALTAMCSGGLRADFNAQIVVDNFAGAGQSTWTFNSTNQPGGYERSFYHNSGIVPNRGAFAVNSTGFYGTQAGTNLFYSFCVNQNINTVATAGTATLNYNAATGVTQNASGQALTVGAAWLFQQYATGYLAGFSYNNMVGAGTRFSRDTNLLQSAINLLMSGGDIIGSTNTFVQAMLQANSSASYWLGTYNVNQRYNEIGDHAIFVMNIRNNGGVANQDHLYIVQANYGGGGSSDVPEPASLLLWTLGGLGLAYTSRARNRRLKKLALS